MTSAHFKQRQEAKSESDRIDALASELQDIVRGEKPVENPLGFLSGLFGDGPSGGFLAVKLQDEVKPLSVHGEIDVLKDERAAAPLGVKFRKQGSKLSVNLAGVFLSHRAAALVVFRPSPCVKDSTAPVAMYEFIKEHICAVLGAVRNLAGHNRIPPVRFWFLSSPPGNTFRCHNSAVKFQSRNYPKVSWDNPPPIEGRAAA